MWGDGPFSQRNKTTKRSEKKTIMEPENLIWALAQISENNQKYLLITENMPTW